MIECYYHLEDYKNLESMIDYLPEGDPLLEKIGDMFAANAVHTEAVKAYVKVSNLEGHYFKLQCNLFLSLGK